MIVLLTAASPLVELRGAIPLGVWIFHLPLIKTIVLSIAGNLLPVFPLLFFLEIISDFLIKKSLFFKKFFAWLFEKTRRKFQKGYLKWGKLALVIFVAIPLPFTGAWTGSLAAFLFGFKKKEAFLLISLGVGIASLIVSFFTFLGVQIF